MSVRLNHADDGLKETHDINVTPFIDVMLVLLVIFMITAPLSTVDVPVNLPVASAEQKPPPQDPVYLSIKSDLSVAVGEQVIDRRSLGSVIQRATKGQRDTTIFVRGDKSVPYGDLMLLMNELRNAGYLKVALVGLEQATGER